MSLWNRQNEKLCTQCALQGRGKVPLETYVGAKTGISWLACTTCDYSIRWPQNRKGICRHIPGCAATLEPKGEE